jgi:hypothetical protein
MKDNVRKVKCRWCDKEFKIESVSDYDALVKHERECFANYEQKIKQQRTNELVENMKHLISLRQEYISFRDKMERMYDKEDLVKYRELFEVKDLTKDVPDKDNYNYIAKDIDPRDLERILKRAFGMER